MRSLLLSLTLVLLPVCALPARGGPAQVRRFQLDSAQSRIGFGAQATLGSFRGTARNVSGWFEGAEPDFSDAHGLIELAVASLQTGMGMRDKHLRETLEAETHPIVRFVLDSARFEADSADARWYRLYGSLTIRNVTRSPDLLARIVQRGDTIFVSGRLPTRFTTFDMKPPTRMLGTTRVKDDFTIVFECVFLGSPL